MVVNLEKTFYEIFSMKNNIPKPNLYFNDTKVNETTAQKYLGVILDQRLTFKFHVDDIVEKAENRMKVIKRLTGTKWGTPKIL